MLTRTQLQTITLPELEAMPVEARASFLEALVAFWRENAREREGLDRVRIGTVPTYRWGE